MATLAIVTVASCTLSMLLLSEHFLEGTFALFMSSAVAERLKPVGILAIPDNLLHPGSCYYSRSLMRTGLLDTRPAICI